MSREKTERLPGAGRKVSAATLNFSTLRMRALVVDTHHLRVVRNLGLTRPHATYEEAYRRLMPRLPAQWGAAELDDHHQLMKALGQTICRPESPRCGACPLQDLCPTGRQVAAADVPGGGANWRVQPPDRALERINRFP